jgi:hypothetical protein
MGAVTLFCFLLIYIKFILHILTTEQYAICTILVNSGVKIINHVLRMASHLYLRQSQNECLSDVLLNYSFSQK